MQEGGCVKNESREQQSVRVPRSVGAKQAGEVRTRWAWTEPVVWTDRMLTALEKGVKGGVWDWPTLVGRTPTLPSKGYSAWKQPMFVSVNPWCGEPPTGEPCAGDPLARFGGRRGRVLNRSFLPLSTADI